MRQLTSQSGGVTYAKSYDPYGVVAQVSGAGQSAYGYTGESQDATSGMVYLRARYYSPLEGRFQSRDTWDGDGKSPMSMNRWGYVEGNPINLTDPSGNHPDCDKTYPAENIDYIENNYSNLTKSDWHDTYVAAGIAVQCWATDLDPFQNGWGDGFGDAQTTDQELTTPWGKPIKNENGKIIKYGKLCYIVTYLTGEVLCECADEAALKNNPKVTSVVPETKVDQRTSGGAAISMYRRIFQTLGSCNKCTATDLFVAAALAQDAQLNMGELRDISGNGDASLRFIVEQRGYNIFWLQFFEDYKKSYNEGREQVQRFDAAVTELKNRGWATPTLNRRGIDSVKNNIWTDFDFNKGR